MKLIGRPRCAVGMWSVGNCSSGDFIGSAVESFRRWDTQLCIGTALLTLARIGSLLSLAAVACELDLPDSLRNFGYMLRR